MIIEALYKGVGQIDINLSRFLILFFSVPAEIIDEILDPSLNRKARFGSSAWRSIHQRNVERKKIDQLLRSIRQYIAKQS